MAPGDLKRSSSVRQQNEEATIIASNRRGNIEGAHAAVISHQRSQSGSGHLNTKPAPQRGLPRVSENVFGKPQFSTYQQHFSPKKAPKAPTISAAHHEPGDEIQEASTPRVIRLQNELLQLQLLYISSCQTLPQQERNVKLRLNRRFDLLVEDHRAIAAQEQDYCAGASHVALQQWLIAPQPWSGSERIQLLSRCVQDLGDLTGSRGRFTAAMEQFEAWFQVMILTLDARSDGIASEHGGDVSVPPLSQDWHDSVSVLTGKLERLNEILKSLGQANANIGLGQVLDSHKLLLSNLLQELESSCRIVKLVLEKERKWIGSSIGEILEETKNPTGSHQVVASRKGIWNLELRI